MIYCFQVHPRVSYEPVVIAVIQPRSYARSCLTKARSLETFPRATPLGGKTWQGEQSRYLTDSVFSFQGTILIYLVFNLDYTNLFSIHMILHYSIYVKWFSSEY